MSAHPMFCVCDICSCRVAMEHCAGDERLGRDWRKGEGCGCAACKLARKNLDDIDASFARIRSLEALRGLIRNLDAPGNERGEDHG